MQLVATNTLQGKAGTASVIAYTVTGDRIAAGVDSFEVIAQGLLPSSTGVLYTVLASQQIIVKEILLANTSGLDVTGVTFYINGTAATNQINGGFTIPANGSATYADGLWTIYTATGAVVATAALTLTGAVTGSGTGTIATTFGSIADLRGLGNISGAPAAPIALTPTQWTASLINDASFTLPGRLTATEKIELNSLDGRTSTGTSPRVFRPGDYMTGNVYDPTGGTVSTSFTAMMTALRAFNDRCTIQLSPGVFKIDHDIIKDFGTNNPSVSIIGPGRGLCILLPNSAPATDKSAMIVLNRGTTGGDAITIRGFTIYNTSGTPYTQGSGILTNGADGVDISEVAYIDLFRDVQVSGQPYTMTTNGTTALTGISPAVSAADNGKVISGPGITPGTTFTFATSSTGTLSAAANNSTTEHRYLDNSIKVSMQKMVSFNTNGGGVGIYVNNGQAGDTYMGPDIVMSDGGGTTRRRACVELVESGHYEITQANLTGSQRGILMDPGTSQSVAFGFHTNVLCDSNTVNGMHVNVVTTATVKNIKSVNSWYSGTVVVNGSAAAAGVKTEGAGTINGFTFTTDRFLNNRTHGFEHTAGTDFRWSDCDMKGNNSANAAGVANPASGNSGLSVAAGVSNWSINGGKYGGTDTVPTAGNQEWGILVAAGAGNNIKISPDDVSGNRLGPLAMGATGASVFINGGPGLSPGYARTTTGANIGAAAVIVVAEALIPKNSVRPGTAFRLSLRGQTITAAGTVKTVTLRKKATTADGVGNTSTGSVISTAASVAGAVNDWLKFDGHLKVESIGAAGQIQGHGTGVQAQLAFGPVAAARASTVGFFAMDTTIDNYIQLVVSPAAASFVPHNSNIEVVNY